MSTASIFIPPDEISELVKDTTSNDFLSLFGNGDEDYGLCPFVSFYIYHDLDASLDLANKVIDIIHEFTQLVDEPLQKFFRSSTENWLALDGEKLPFDPRMEAKKFLEDERDFIFGATEHNVISATPLWAIHGIVEYDPYTEYSAVKMVFRHRWYNQNKPRWHQFVNSCIERLQPEHCYSGFEVSSGPLGIMGNYEAETLERVLADYFYGLDIDHQLFMYYHTHEEPDRPAMPSSLGAGIRTPTWCFMLSPYWLNKLGKTENQVRAELDHPDITITAFPYPKNNHNPENINGLWIQLGELDLHPVGKGKPELLVKANELIKPIRCDELSLTSLDTWADDPNPRFDVLSGVKWMRRFDKHSDWLYQRVKTSPVPEGIFVAKPGEDVPKGGLWFSPALGNPSSARYFEQGQQLPVEKTSVYGDEVVWYWVDDDDIVE